MLQAHLAGGRSHETVIADDLMTEESLRSRDFTLPYSTRPLSLLTQVTFTTNKTSKLINPVAQSADSGDFTTN